MVLARTQWQVYILLSPAFLLMLCIRLASVILLIASFQYQISSSILLIICGVWKKSVIFLVSFVWYNLSHIIVIIHPIFRIIVVILSMTTWVVLGGFNCVPTYVLGFEWIWGLQILTNAPKSVLYYTDNALSSDNKSHCLDHGVIGMDCLYCINICALHHHYKLLAGYSVRIFFFCLINTLHMLFGIIHMQCTWS